MTTTPLRRELALDVIWSAADARAARAFLAELRGAPRAGDEADAVPLPAPARSGAPEAGDAAGASDVPGLSAAEARVRARAAIAAHLRGLDAYAMQDLVADLLRATGYPHVVVSPPGADGGTDLLAWRDPYGAVTPHLRVQVKHWSGRVGREAVAALRGILAAGRETGLLVATGGFTRAARREAERGDAHVALMDLDGFLALWVRHADALPDTARARLRLVPVWLLEDGG